MLVVGYSNWSTHSIVVVQPLPLTFADCFFEVDFPPQFQSQLFMSYNGLTKCLKCKIYNLARNLTTVVLVPKYTYIHYAHQANQMPHHMPPRPGMGCVGGVGYLVCLVCICINVYLMSSERMHCVFTEISNQHIQLNPRPH